MESESKSFFWGMTLHPEKRYAQTAAEPFHVSKACVEPSSLKKGEGKPLTSIYLESENEEFLLCTLSTSNLNENLDLNFNRGEKICMRTEGGGIVHLTGYLMESPEYDFDESDFEEEESEVDESETEEVDVKNAKANGIAKKLSPLDKLVAEAKKKNPEKAKKPEEVKAEIKRAEEMKKILSEKKSLGESDSDEDDEDDSDDDDDNMLELEAEEDDSDDDEGEEEEEEDSSDEEEVPAKKSPEKKAQETPKTDKKEKKKNAEQSPVQTPGQKKVKGEQQTPKSEKKSDKSAANSPAEGKKNKDKTPAKKEGEANGAKNTPKNKEGQANGAAAATPGKTPKKTLKGGLVLEDLKVGNGPDVKPGKMVGVYYVGKLKANNKQFDACKEGSKPFKFRVGKGEVIKAWDVGLEGMKVGGKRRLICPPALAYGAKGAPPDIPPNSTLVFEVELKSVN